MKDMSSAFMSNKMSRDQVEEETGIHINSTDLISLTDLLEESTGQKMFPSPVRAVLKRLHFVTWFSL